MPVATAQRLTDLSEASDTRRSAPHRHRDRLGPLLVLVALVVASILALDPSGVRVNADGWPNVARFWRAAFRPDLSLTSLELAARSAATTLSYAVLGTGLALGIGAAFAPLLSRRWLEPVAPRSVARRALAVGSRQLARLGDIFPRSVNEVVWALLAAQIWGTSPVVALLAIAIPFGAVTAAVFADTIDEADAAPYRALRRAGVGHVGALSYGILPTVAADLISYAGYRLECAVRAAAILGIVGAGGLGYQIDLSFQSLRYPAMWTMIWTLVAIAGAADGASAMLRRRVRGARSRCGDIRVPGPDDRRVPPHATRHATFAPRLLAAAVVAIVAVVAAARWVSLDISVLWEPRRRDLLVRLIGDMTPPRLGPGGWSALTRAMVETVAMSVLALVLSATIGLLMATLSARPRTPTRWRFGQRGRVSPARVGASAGRVLVRFSMLTWRSVPSPVWVFLFTLVILPGPWPGVAALGVYNAGVMARLFAESMEDLHPGATEALTTLGATRAQQMAYAVLPELTPRLVALSVYRWEVIMRETVVVGVAGSAGLGRLIKDDLVARDFASLTTSMLALTVLTTAAATIGSQARARLR
jgi:phosphonate transport system permease protein